MELSACILIGESCRVDKMASMSYWKMMQEEEEEEEEETIRC